MSELDGRFEGQVTARDLRGQHREQPVAAAAAPVRGWDWDAEELSPPERAELEQLRAEREILTTRVAELEQSLAATARREAALSQGLQRLARAHWLGRRRIAGELRRAGLLEG